MDRAHIGRYEIHEPLGQGGMGTVYKGRDPLMDRWVALKAITVRDSRQRGRFQQEVRAAGRLNHPHITLIYDVGEEDDLAYIVMELVEGDTLASRLSFPVPWHEAVSLLLPICQALAYAHERGVIHRDVKPSNILISTEGQVKLTDFGVARLEAALRLTEPGTPVGTPLYNAPEQIQGEVVDGRADLFSLGIVLFELATGRHPFAGESLAQVVYRITQPEPANLEPLATLAPPALADLVGRALNKDPAARFPNADGMASAMAACLEQPTPSSSPLLSRSPASPPPHTTAPPRPRLETVSELSLSPAEEALLLADFAGYDRVYLEREFSGGYSGARVLLATPVRSGRRLAQIVIKLDTPTAIDREWTAYKEYVEDTLPPVTARILEEPRHAEDGELALLRYTFAGGLGHVPPESLRTYYARHTGEDVATLLEKSLFQAFGHKWWLQRSAKDFILRWEYDRLLPVHLVVKLQQLSEETPRSLVAGKVSAHACRHLESGQLVQIQGFVIEDVQADQGEMTLQASSPSGTPTNPIRVRVEALDPDQITYQVGQVVPSLVGEVTVTRHDLLHRLAEPAFPGQDLGQKEIVIGSKLHPNPLYDYESLLDRRASAMTSIIHGDLNLENILVTPPSGPAWLIDFATTREGHNLYDFIRLEAQVITKLLPQVTMDPEAAVRLMQALHQPDLSAGGLPPELKKSFAVLAAIRQMAQACLYNRESWDEYYLGLTLTLVGALKFKELDTSSRSLVLAAAAAVRGLISIPSLQITPPSTVPTPSPPRPWLKVAVGAIGLMFFLVILAGLGLWFFSQTTYGFPPGIRLPGDEGNHGAGQPFVPDTPALTLVSPVAAVPSPSPTNTPKPSPPPLPPPHISEGNVLGPLDIRGGPGLDYAVLGSIPEGNPVRVTGRSADGKWWQIAHPSGPGGYGWILAEFVELKEALTPPIALASPPPTATPTSTVTPTPTETPMLPTTSSPESPSLDEYRLFFAANLGGEYRIYTMTLGDRRPIQITDGPGDEGRPALSPDGKNLAFASNRNGNLDIFVLNLDTQESRQLTSDPEHDHTPAWSPDGRRIAFQSKRAGNYDIYVMDADGTNPIALTDHPADDYWPTWSPNGTQILFESRRDSDSSDRSQLYLMNANGSNQMRLIESSGSDGMPAWSPTGQIAFYSDRDGNRELYLMDSLGALPRRLTTNSTNDWFPAWSPDGRYLAYTSGDYKQGKIYILDTTDQSISQLTQFDADTSDPVMAFAIHPLRLPNVTIEDFEAYNTVLLQQTYTLNNAWGKNELAIDVTRLADVTDQGQVLALIYNIRDLPPDNYVGAERTLQTPQDWSDFSAVRFWARNGATPRDLVFQWREASTRDSEAWKARSRLGPDETRLVEIPLSPQYFVWADWSPAGNGQMDLDQVGYYSFFIEQAQPGSGIIYLDSLELLPRTVAPLTQPAVIPTPRCQLGPAAEFQILWNSYHSEMGCPLGSLVVIPTLAEQLFEGGHLFWRSDTDDVYVVYDRRHDGTNLLAGKWQMPRWKWDGSDPDGIGLSPPAGRFEPIRGFGWLWRTHMGGSVGPLGWALDREYGFDHVGRAQQFEKGLAFKGSDPKVYALLNDGRFLAYAPSLGIQPPPATLDRPDTGYRPLAVFELPWNNLDQGDGPLGYPLDPGTTDRNYARQFFERGFMFWWDAPHPPQPIWVIYLSDPVASSGDTWTQYEDLWKPGQPEYPPDCPEAGPPLGPRHGFGLTWCLRPGVKELVGWPREGEFGSGDLFPKGAVQFFQGGMMFENPDDHQIWALIYGAGWYKFNY